MVTTRQTSIIKKLGGSSDERIKQDCSFCMQSFWYKERKKDLEKKCSSWLKRTIKHPVVIIFVWVATKRLVKWWTILDNHQKVDEPIDACMEVEND